MWSGVEEREGLEMEMGAYNTNRFILVSQSLWLLWFEQHLL